jgi:murein DD-endopeptidase MepM/ murein hydrolase activator NlpD
MRGRIGRKRWRWHAATLAACAVLVTSPAAAAAGDATGASQATVKTSRPDSLAKVLRLIDRRHRAVEVLVFEAAVHDHRRDRRLAKAMIARADLIDLVAEFRSRQDLDAYGGIDGLADAAAGLAAARERNAHMRRAYRLAERASTRAHARLERAFDAYVVLVQFVAPNPSWVCPVRGPMRHYDDWGAPRDGGLRRHEGNDLLADRGTPVVAVAEGVARQQPNRLGGNAVAVDLADGTHFYYAHLDAYEGAFPRLVRAGDVVGYVGDTGNAKGGPTHLHFEWHPFGGEPRNPYPLAGILCDGWRFDPNRPWPDTAALDTLAALAADQASGGAVADDAGSGSEAPDAPGTSPTTTPARAPGRRPPTPTPATPTTASTTTSTTTTTTSATTTTSTTTPPSTTTTSTPPPTEPPAPEQPDPAG